MRFFFLLSASFFAALGMGYLKFFVLGYFLSDDGPYGGAADEAWLIQLIGSIMTLGPVLAFAVSAPLVSSFLKRWVMFSSLGIVVIFLLLAYISHWAGTAWLYLFGVGLIVSVFSAGKMASIPIEAKSGPRSTASVNGLASIVFIIGMLLGIPLGTHAFEAPWSSEYGIFLGMSFFAIAGIASCFLSYQDERLVDFSKSSQLLLKDSLSLAFKYSLYLLSAPLIWAIGASLSLAVTAYAKLHEMGTIVECTLMPLYAAIGIILGTLISTRFLGMRYIASTVAGVLLIVLIAALPIWVESMASTGATQALYLPLAIYMVILGVCFGVCTNLVDSEYLKKVEEDGKEGTGAALHSAAIALFTFSVGALVGCSIILEWMTSVTQFIVLAAFCLLAIIPIVILAIKSGTLDKAIGYVSSRAMSCLLRLRYRIHLSGTENIPRNGKGVLFLPNHPAEMDPIIIGSILWKDYRPRPVVVEKFYHMPFVNRIMRIMKAIPMPDMETGTGVYKKRRIDDALNSVCAGLAGGNAVIMYPSGRLMRSSQEVIGGASGVYRILQKTEDIEIILVKTRGLWGSSFSTALTNGKTPDLKQAFIHGLFVLLKNFILFTPRRKVDVEFTLLNVADIKDLDALEINKRLEAYYNADGDEALSLVSYSFLYKKLLEANVKEVEESRDLSAVTDEQINSIRHSFAKAFKLDENIISADSRLANDLGMDSLSKAELLIWMDEEYEVGDIEMEEVQFFSDIVLAALGERKDIKHSENKVSAQWDDKNRPDPCIPDGDTLQECFLMKCDQMGDAVAFADEVSGIVTWKKLKIGALLFSSIFKRYPGEYVAIMLPASVAANIVTMAVLLSGKIPVMLNWTVGRKNLEHARRTAAFEVVITSSAFLDKVDNVDFGELENDFVFIEEIRKDEIGKGDMIIAALEARNSADALMRQLELKTVDKDAPGVILFTSGSEAAPKGVPLSHSNMLSNIRSIHKLLKFHDQTSLYGFLPAFHSFGFIITMIMPMMAGIKTAYHPNPNEGRRIARGCSYYGTTLMCGTPTFISNVFRASKEHQLDSLEYIVVGAEKMPASLVEKVDALPNTQILEGYGITECSPVITLNCPDKPAEGVGPPLSCVELLIVDLDSYEPRDQGERGLILVRGPSIFHAYLGEVKEPFVEVKGKRWYNTGDLGYLTAGGSLVLAGRLKRFVKIGGEMISLPALEEALAEKWPTGEDGPVLAIHAVELEGKRPELCLFAAVDIELEQANEALVKSGFSNLSKIKRMIKLEELPTLGTGKTDYQTLKRMM